MIFLGNPFSRILWRQCLSRPTRSIYSSSFSTTTSTRSSTRKSSDRLNYNSDISFEDSPGDHINNELVTANDLEGRTEPPNRVNMLVRDFIEDSLYNPNYGYFPQQATIFTSSKNQIDFSSLRDSVEFQNEVAKRYTAYGGEDQEGPGKQLWHTPTELFKVRSCLCYRCSMDD